MKTKKQLNPPRRIEKEYERRESGLRIREIGGGWQIATRTEFHEEVREFLKTRPIGKIVARVARNSRRHRISTTRYSSRNSGNSRRSISLFDQNPSRQTPDHFKRSQRNRRTTDDVRNFKRFFDSIWFERFIGIALDRRF